MVVPEPRAELADELAVALTAAAVQGREGVSEREWERAWVRACLGDTQLRFFPLLLLVCLVRLESSDDTGNLQSRHLFLVVPVPPGKVSDLFFSTPS